MLNGPLVFLVVKQTSREKAHLHICTLAHWHICPLAHLPICTFAQLHSCTVAHYSNAPIRGSQTGIALSVPVRSFLHENPGWTAFAHLPIFTFAHLHICPFSHLHIFTFAHLHICTSAHRDICPLFQCPGSWLTNRNCVNFCGPAGSSLRIYKGNIVNWKCSLT